MCHMALEFPPLTFPTSRMNEDLGVKADLGCRAGTTAYPSSGEWNPKLLVPSQLLGSTRQVHSGVGVLLAG